MDDPYTTPSASTAETSSSVPSWDTLQKDITDSQLDPKDAAELYRSWHDKASAEIEASDIPTADKWQMTGRMASKVADAVNSQRESALSEWDSATKDSAFFWRLAASSGMMPAVPLAAGIAGALASVGYAPYTPEVD